MNSKLIITTLLLGNFNLLIIVVFTIKATSLHLSVTIVLDRLRPASCYNLRRESGLL